MAEIPGYTFIAIGLVITIASIVINWGKFLLFIIAGVIMILYGIIKNKRKK